MSTFENFSLDALLKVNALEERKSAGTDKSRELSAALKQLQSESSAHSTSTKTAREKRATLEGRLTEVVGQLRSSKAEYRESERERKSTEAVENLMRLFPGESPSMTFHDLP